MKDLGNELNIAIGGSTATSGKDRSSGASGKESSDDIIGSAADSAPAAVHTRSPGAILQCCKYMRIFILSS